LTKCTKRRNRLKQEKGETYDPIYFSDDEWITGKENPCLPIDSSWMDVHECFDVEEGAPSKKEEERLFVLM